MLLFLLRHDVPRTGALGLEKEPVVGRKVAAIQNCDVTRTFFFFFVEISGGTRCLGMGAILSSLLLCLLLFHVIPELLSLILVCSALRRKEQHGWGLVF